MPDESSLPDEHDCAKALREHRWDGEVRCVHCFSDTVVKNGRRSDHIQQYRCRSCETAFNDRTGTVFETTRMRLHECIHAVRRSRDDESINRIADHLGRSWSTVDTFLKRFRSQMVGEKILEVMPDPDDGERTDLDIDYGRFGCG
jgi:transposase-like protein